MKVKSFIGVTSRLAKRLVWEFPRIWISSIEEIEVLGEPTSNSKVLNPPSGGSAGHVDRRGV